MRWIFMFGGCLVAAVALQAQQPSAPQKTTQDAPYILIGTRRTSTMAKELAAAASAGYQVVSASASDGMENVLVLRKGSDGERSEYRIVSNESYLNENYRGSSTRDLPLELPAFEKKLNEAAAHGFRLVPQGLIVDGGNELGPLIAVMEKRAQSAPGGYRVLDGFDRHEADQKLAAAARAGYRVVTMLTRDRDARNEPLFMGKFTRPSGKFGQQLIVVLEKTADASQGASDAAGRYRTVTAMESEFERALNVAAAAGYHLLEVARNGYLELIAIFERNAPADGRAWYAVLAPQTSSTIASELGQAASGAWLPHPRGVIDAREVEWLDKVGRMLFVLEKSPTRAARPEFLVVGGHRSDDRIAKDLVLAVAAGFELVNSGYLMGNKLMIVLKRSTPGSARQ